MRGVISSAPYMDYRFLEIRRRNQLIGLSVVRFQNTPAGAACRVIDFIAPPEDALHCWSVTATACADAGGLFSDFHVVGTVFDEALIAGGFQLPEKDPVLDAVPNLLSPVDHRKWTNTFHLAARMLRVAKNGERRIKYISRKQTVIVTGPRNMN